MASADCFPSLSDLLLFVRRHARIDSTNYFDPRYARPEEVKAWNRARYRRNFQRKACLHAFPGRLRSASEPLVPGRYGRLSISASGEIDYVVGQDASMEVWPALLSYLQATN